MMTTPIIMKYDDRCLENATHINIMDSSHLYLQL